MSSHNDYEVVVNELCREFSEGDRVHKVLDGVSLSVLRGETVAVRGRSGCGKSTLLNLVGGIDAPDAGQVTVAGVELSACTETERTLFRRRSIGFVYQSFNLIPTLTVADNIRLVLELNKVQGALARDQVDEMLALVSLSERGSSYPDVLSGGEQQRVAIARALVHRPALLIADEPTGNLDDANAESVMQLLDRLVRDAGGTMLIATHSQRVSEYCDRVVEIHDGKVDEVTPQ